MKEITIRNWDELQQMIFRDVWEEDIKRYRANYIYRGVGDASFDLQPKLHRVCSHKMELEDSVLRSFRKYGYAELKGVDGFWQTLTLAQHHGLPTRLIDWSYSPLVAAHFATDELENYDKDGVIWCVDYSKLVSQIPQPLRVLLDEQKTELFSIEMLEKVAHNFQDLSKYSDKPYALFFEPASLHNRIINQYALFSLVSDLYTPLSAILEQYEEDCFKIIIPKEVKLEIRDKLDYINISERMIYPGLDGICKWITRRYSNLGPYYNGKRNI